MGESKDRLEEPDKAGEIFARVGFAAVMWASLQALLDYKLRDIQDDEPLVSQRRERFDRERGCGYEPPSLLRISL
jgi:hypothetical protein